jgi:transposase-like protein
MNSKTFNQWLKGLEKLSSQQLSSLKTAIERTQEAVTQTINEASVKCCPHCQGQNLQKFGWKNELQRYRCKLCKVTFNRLSGTPLARLRKKDQWFGVVESLNARQTLNQMQESLFISRPTAVRWRKRFLAALKPDAPLVLNGIVEADETYIRRGQKGTLCKQRPPRKRGEPARPGGTQREDYVCVLTARDRNKQIAHQLPDSQKKEVFEAFLAPLIAKDSILCSDGLSSYQKFTQKHGIQHVVLRSKHGEFVKAGVYHIQNVNAYHSRIKQFFSRLKGVADRNINLYLAWVDYLDSLSNSPEPLTPQQIMRHHIFNI